MTTTSYDGKVFTVDSFTAQTTNASGEITVALTHTPFADQCIMVNLQGVAGAFAQFSSRSGANVTFKVYQKYDKTNNPITGNLSNLPASVTEKTGVTTYTSGGNSSSTQYIGGTGGSLVAADGHTHNTQITGIYRHDHTPTYTATAISTLNSTGSITLVVSYAF